MNKKKRKRKLGPGFCPHSSRKSIQHIKISHVKSCIVEDVNIVL